MAVKRAQVEGIGEIILSKRKGARNVRLRITHEGRVAVTLPIWLPYRIGLAFANEKRAWIMQQKRPQVILHPNTRIGKAHTIVFMTKPERVSIHTRVTLTSINTHLPSNVAYDHPQAQLAAHKASIRALKQEANQLLPQRLAYVAAKNGFDYRSVKIKHLKGRWGSCNQHQDIVLNCFLMQLPWELIDYVILHELMHTKIMAHGAPFWTALSEIVPNLSETRKTMRSKQPILIPLMA